jgi:hypothetical protein
VTDLMVNRDLMGDRFIRHLHRKLREWHRLGFVSCVAWADTICEDMTSMQRQSEELGISVRCTIVIDRRELTLA